jgi:hypothetical protein
MQRDYQITIPFALVGPFLGHIAQFFPGKAFKSYPFEIA